MTKEDIVNEYSGVRNSLENAIAASETINVSGEEENAELENIRKVLHEINTDFKAEISELENSSEWDKFCMAFFGETNAGKSTIIESLRIVYDEELRYEQILKQWKNYKNILSGNVRDYSELKRALTELNVALKKHKHNKVKHFFAILGWILIGIVIGAAASFFIVMR